MYRYPDPAAAKDLVVVPITTGRLVDGINPLNGVRISHMPTGLVVYRYESDRFEINFSDAVFDLDNLLYEKG